MKRLFTLIALAASVAGAAPKIANSKISVAPQSQKIDLAGEESSVEFVAVVKPGSIRINGNGAKLAGTVTVSEKSLIADLVVHLKDFQTGISLRDKHMKEKFLEVDKYPDATLKITEMPLPQSPMKAALNLKAVPFKGVLNLHGVDNAVSGTADIDSTGASVLVDVKTATTISAHKIEKPGYLGVTVADDVDITAHLKLKK
jgi:polyisoprenoid-binding protein YceI